MAPGIGGISYLYRMVYQLIYLFGQSVQRVFWQCTIRTIDGQLSPPLQNLGEISQGSIGRGQHPYTIIRVGRILPGFFQAPVHSQNITGSDRIIRGNQEFLAGCQPPTKVFQLF